MREDAKQIVSLEQLKRDLEWAYDRQLEARDFVYDAGEKVIELKNALAGYKSDALAAGRIEGKNEDLREAAAVVMFRSMYVAVREAEADERRAKYQLDHAGMMVEKARALLRLAELAERVAEI